MAEVKAVPTPAPEYVEIPEKDLFDEPHPGVGINANHYGPGKHLVDASVAETIRERLRRFNRQQIRLLQPGRDIEAVNVISRNGSSGLPAGS